MGFSFVSLGAHIRETFESRLREVSKTSSCLLFEKHRKFILFAGALLFGILAYRVTANEARIDWLMSNRPRIETWELLLASKFYVPVLNPDTLEALIPSLPYLRSGRDPRAWITENSRVVVLYEPEGTRVYSLGKGVPDRIAPELWEPLGHGWDAFENLSRRTLPLPREEFILPRKKAIKARDPREIDF